MQLSSEIIEVFEYIAGKIGITIDWTSANVIPIVEQICKKFVAWEFSTSLTWIVIAFGVSIVVFIAAKCADGWDGFEWLIFWIVTIIAIVVISCQIFDIIECCVFPEKTIYDYVKMHFVR